MESATRTAARHLVASRRTRWSPGRRRTRPSSPRWLWTATTCLVAATTGPASTRSSLPLTSAFALRTNGSIGSRHRRGLFAGKSGDDSSDLAPDSFTIHSSLSELLQEFDYDALILDQFGVLHNGKNALEGTIDCVERIASGKTTKGDATANASKDENAQSTKQLKLIVLSNTSSPSKTTLDRLQTKLGFDGSYFCGAVTSGEEAGRHIQETYGSDTTKPTKFVWCTWDASNENVPDPTAFLELCGPNVEPTVDVASADFVVAHGSGAIRGFGSDRQLEIISMGSFMDDGNLGEGTPIHDLLTQCAEKKLPLVCANPDMVVQYHDGSLKHMPGKIAQRYQEILEDRRKETEDLPSITIYGKPHTEHFEACLRKLEEDQQQQRGLPPPTGASGNTEQRPLRVAHVGDSIHHDIAGANASGVPSIFIVGGIHAEELLSSDDDKGMPSEEILREFFAKEGITPTHVLPVFNY